MADKSVPGQIAAAIFAKLPAGTRAGFGERARYFNEPAPRVVAVPRGATVIDQPDRHGDQGFATAGRILLLRRFVIDFFCHGETTTENGEVDFGPAEDLYIATLKAARNYGHNAVRFADERWLDQEEGADGLIRYGAMIVFTSTWHLPVYAARGRRVTLQATPPIDTTELLNDEEV